MHGSTGQRKGRHPVATLDIADDGSWGPVRGLSSRKHYEFALVDPGQITHHIYFEPFKRSNHLVRLLTSEPGGGVNILIERSPRHSALTIVRYKELWGDQGRRERRAPGQRHERDQRRHGADHEARDRDVRVRHGL